MDVQYEEDVYITESLEVIAKKKQLEDQIKSKSIEEVRSIWNAIQHIDEILEFHSPGITWEWWCELIYSYAKI